MLRAVAVSAWPGAAGGRRPVLAGCAALNSSQPSRHRTIKPAHPGQPTSSPWRTDAHRRTASSCSERKQTTGSCASGSGLVVRRRPRPASGLTHQRLPAQQRAGRPRGLAEFTSSTRQWDLPSRSCTTRAIRAHPPNSLPSSAWCTVPVPKRVHPRRQRVEQPRRAEQSCKTDAQRRILAAGDRRGADGRGRARVDEVIGPRLSHESAQVQHDSWIATDVRVARTEEPTHW